MDARIDARVDRMLAEGWVEECRRLRADPRGVSREAAQALGYRELFRWLDDGAREPLEEVAARTKTSTRRFARRQLTWLRRVDDAESLTVRPGQDPRRHREAVLRALAGE